MADRAREELQERMSEVLSLHGCEFRAYHSGIRALWELVEVHYAGKCAQHESEARRDERERVCAEMQAAWNAALQMSPTAALAHIEGAIFRAGKGGDHG